MSISVKYPQALSANQLERAFFDGGGNAEMLCSAASLRTRELRQLPYADISVQKERSRARLTMAVDYKAIADREGFAAMLAAFGRHAAETKLLWGVQQQHAWSEYKAYLRNHVEYLRSHWGVMTGGEVGTYALGNTGEFVTRTLIQELLRAVRCTDDCLHLVELQPNEHIPLVQGFKLNGTRHKTLHVARRNRRVEYDHLLLQGKNADQLWFVDTTTSYEHLQKKIHSEHDFLKSLGSAYAKQARYEDNATPTKVHLMLLHITDGDASASVIRREHQDHSVLVQLPLLSETVRLAHEALAAAGYHNEIPRTS